MSLLYEDQIRRRAFIGCVSQFGIIKRSQEEETLSPIPRIVCPAASRHD